MAIRIEAQLSKKIPIPGSEFSSQQASIAISAEVTDPAHVVQEAQRLYSLAVQAVDQQLGIVAAQSTPIPRSHAQQTIPRPSQASQPFPNTQRRGPAPITDSQLKYLNRLISQGNHSLSAILHDFQIGSLGDLTCKDGADLISRLKAGVA